MVNILTNPRKILTTLARRAVPARLQRARAMYSRWKIKSSGLFDSEYYRICNAGVVPNDADPLDHYNSVGWQLGLRPSAEFDPQLYLEQNPDVKTAQINPLLHYLSYGKSEGRVLQRTGLSNSDRVAAIDLIRSSGLFDEAFYTSQVAIARDPRTSPIEHYCLVGADSYLEVSPNFSLQAYLAENPDARRSGQNPLLHYIEHVQKPGRTGKRSTDQCGYVNGEHKPLPDNIVELERMAGIAYFVRFGMSFESDAPLGKVAEATWELASKTPSLTIDNITPHVSIIIPVYGQLPFALACLDSLSRQRSRFSVEIIVVDDASPKQGETERLQAIPWIRYIRNQTNGGFLHTCNNAASVARGHYLIFLNSDTRLARGWLDELIGSFAIFPKAGLVGSKLLNDDLSLQEAGGLFWGDGSAWNYGRGDDPNNPRYCFARRVDYCSGAAIAVSRDAWAASGGFDPIYTPAYCEDADIAFKLRSLGYETWYQPLARVIHYEGKTHGRDVTKGIKAYQTTNLKTFDQRWRSTLAQHRPNGLLPHLEANRPARKQLLMIDAVTPTPDKDSGSLVTLAMIRSFQELGYQITFIPQTNYAYIGDYSDSLLRMGVQCIYQPLISSLDGLMNITAHFDLVVVYRVNIASEVLGMLRARMPTAPVIFHNIDLHYLREKRAALLENNRPGLLQAAITQRAELEVIAKVDCTIVTSPVETQEIQSQMPAPLQTILVFPFIADVHRSPIGYDQRHDIMFLAGFAHPPNIDAAVFFVEKIWPHVVDRLPPEAKFLIVGAEPASKVRALASDRIVVTGQVPDLAPWFDKARVFTAPLRYGAGVKGKVVQSLAHGVPSVITSVAAEGIGMTAGDHAIVADDPQKIADEIVALYYDRAAWSRMQHQGYQFVETNFSQTTCRELCSRSIDIAYDTWIRRDDAVRRKRLDDIIEHDGAAALATATITAN